MSEAEPLAGKVVAIVGTGSDLDRAIAVACAEAGADVALGTERATREQDYRMNSVANEIWAIGREHFVRVMDADSEELGAFLEEVRQHLRRCDAVVCSYAIQDAGGVLAVAPASSGEATVMALAERLRGGTEAPAR